MNQVLFGMRFVAIAVFAVAWSAMADEPEVVNYLGLEGGPGSGSECRNLTIDYPSPFTNALAWSDGQLPHKGATYVAGQIDGADSVLWTPIYSVATTYDMLDTLVLDGCYLCIRHTFNRAAIFNDLRVTSDSYIWTPNTDTVLGGKLTVGDDVLLVLATYNNRHLRLESDLSGSGSIRCASQGGTSAYLANFSFLGANTNFFGKIQVRNSYKQQTFDHCTTFYITNAIGLGGNLPEFKYDALNLTRMSRLVANASDIVLPASANRGISIGVNSGRFSVIAGGTFTVNCPITLGGYTLYKEGPGHLVLGQPLRFTSVAEGTSNSAADSKENPISGKTHSVDVREGTVSVTDCNALNGAKIAFSNETAFVMSVNLPEGDLKTYGLRCDKALYAPLATTMPIRLRATVGGTKLAEGRSLVSLVTVKSTYAEDVESKLAIEELPAGCRLLGIASAAAEGVSSATTFKAIIVRKGMTVSFR